MRTEIKKHSYRGFFLPEQEFRRLSEIITEQIGKAPGSAPANVICEVGFRNGGVMNGATVGEVLALPNGDSGSIQHLQIAATSAATDAAYEVSITFRVFAAIKREQPISYQIRGEDRDWAFVTTSFVEERLARIKRFPFATLWSSGLAVPIFLIVFLFSLLTSMVVIPLRAPIGLIAAIDSMTHDRSLGKPIDPADAVLHIERVKATSDALRGNRVMFVVPVALTLIIGLIACALRVLRPSYTFYWGDAVAIYDRRLKIGYFVGVILLLGTLISILGSLVANRVRIPGR